MDSGSRDVVEDGHTHSGEEHKLVYCNDGMCSDDMEHGSQCDGQYGRGNRDSRGKSYYHKDCRPGLRIDVDSDCRNHHTPL